MKNLSHDIELKNFLAILDPNVNPEHCRIGQTEIITVRKEVRKYGAFR